MKSRANTFSSVSVRYQTQSVHALRFAAIKYLLPYKKHGSRHKIDIRKLNNIEKSLLLAVKTITAKASCFSIYPMRVTMSAN